MWWELAADPCLILAKIYLNDMGKKTWKAKLVVHALVLFNKDIAMFLKKEDGI